mgnify:CR=1 FL=1
MSIITVKFPLERTGKNIGFDGLTDQELLEAIKFNVKNIIFTIPGERVFDVNFGVGIKRYLFEFPSPSLANELYANIQDQLTTYAPYISVQDISVRKNDDLQKIKVSISYRVPQVDLFDKLEITTDQF